MLLPVLYALPHPNFFKLYVRTSGLACTVFLYLLPLSGTRCLTMFVSVNLLTTFRRNTLKHFISNQHSLATHYPSASDSILIFGTIIWLPVLTYLHSYQKPVPEKWNRVMGITQDSHSPGEPGKKEKGREFKSGHGKKESVFLHMVNYCEYWSWHKMCKKRNYLLGKIVHHMKSERRKDAYCARCKLCLKTFSLINMGKQAVVSHSKSSGHVRNVAEKARNLIMTGEWPPWWQVVDSMHHHHHHLILKHMKWVSK